MGEIEFHPYRFPDLDARAEDLKARIISKSTFTQLMSQRDSLGERGRRSEPRRRSLSVAGWVSLGGGLLAATGSLLSLLLGNQAMAVYHTATSTMGADAARFPGRAIHPALQCLHGVRGFTASSLADPVGQ